MNFAPLGLCLCVIARNYKHVAPMELSIAIFKP
jgi:hypothetical protein